MNLLEYSAKHMVLSRAGIPVPNGILCLTPEDAAGAYDKLGACVIKAQVSTGKRGKSGGVRLAFSADEAKEAAAAILALTINGFPVAAVLAEEKADIEREYYAAILPDPVTRSPMVLFSEEGGMDIEELAERKPEAIRRFYVDVSAGFSEADAAELAEGPYAAGIAPILVRLYEAFVANDGELLEINPLAVLKDKSIVALDCKFILDPAAAFRQPELAATAVPERRTRLEKEAEDAGLKFIELEGNVAILANGAGLTMTTMDAVSHFGGRPANFQEIGGEAYTKAETALRIVLSNPGVKSLVVNFCGAFARTDVMAEGVVAAWEKLTPEIPVFFSIHGTGSGEAINLVRSRLGFEPYDFMEDAVKAAVEAAR
ncbi:Succinate--CoA ligase (ADP-forming) [Rhodomicrobium vannielii ATCC 17100]|uniref:Succinate--CoA ligase (ADP-forming) n=1 Tax=Rhodomicrobium vannielii (strain ATCC 17100 / DSM 162 / LMG 4299 / NCIMB 10020 / ATH 3.1.1) TaxID=648757 RepID=E3I3G2_RHOVT|nr:ATP-grasp domain-containing protein [Rhodomicrobium vannielii]ADP72610.1 Succinate--CoA ligase (ADP-forming) [Rhodomicrobium vannielii ATCC 17100]